MASLAEQQPVKKRKLYESPKDPTATQRPTAAFPLSPEDILRRRRNKEEIRNLYECYKRIKFCVFRKDPRLMADLEQAYLSLITASRGCTSVQRIVAELIPRYATFCPTALEAAAKVSINMYNWSLVILMRGEDLDGVAYQTAKACIFGLVDICSTATSEAPTSSVIRGICASVFQNVLIFFTSSFEGKEIYGIRNKEILMLQDPIENFCALKQEKEDDSESSLNKLFKYGALCLLRIFFSFPKNLLAACFELITTSGADADNKHGQYFLDQVTSPLKADVLSHTPNKKNDGAPLSMDLASTSVDCEVLDEGKCVSGDIVAESTPCSSKNCFMGMVISREPSLKDWILARYKKLTESPSTHDALGISSYLEKVLGPVQELIKESVYEQSDEENFDSSSHALRHAIYRKVIHDDNLGDLSRKDHASEQESSFGKAACMESITPKRATHNLQSQKSVHLSDVDIEISNRGLFCEGEISESINKLEIGTFEDSHLGKSSRPNGSASNISVSAISRGLPGKVPNQWSKDDVLHGMLRKGVRSPKMVTDLTSESALLLEFGSAEDATAAMTHIRHLYVKSLNTSCLQTTVLFTQKIDRGIWGLFHIMMNAKPIREAQRAQENFIHELASPRAKMEKSGTTVLKGHDIQSNWSVKGITEFVNVGSRELERSISMELPLSGTPTSSHTAEAVWPYSKTETGAQLFVHGTMPYAHGSSVIPPPIHSTPSIRPFYSSNNSWDNPSLNPSFIMLPHDRRHLSSHTPLPFIPSSITPLSHIPTGSIQRFDRTVNVSTMPTLIPPPPLPSSPPPLPPSLPPPIPPPPTSPPPISQPTHETTKMRSGKLSQQHQWQGTLSKSGVHYCTLYATREGSLTCKYINAGPEPAEWPAKLDVTKRTDFRHVRTTFGNIPPHRREVCRLLPSTTSDNKGFNDFISYLRQRECAGVIKIPAARSMRARLLFILPHSLELCSMLGIPPQPTESLIALVLPKETGSELP
ncbi:hypothetical protein KSP40_PGU019155 [Platanthera guangdongensis]|uniref:Spen paralogue and orthologue SPOC C-terminal domain-containing protein n=1 Tax=Platanthera guangdongensis TaxID=2320717 RepID=A0ABR2MLJ3_9ASPA